MCNRLSTLSFVFTWYIHPWMCRQKNLWAFTDHKRERVISSPSLELSLRHYHFFSLLPDDWFLSLELWPWLVPGLLELGLTFWPVELLSWELWFLFGWFMFPMGNLLVVPYSIKILTGCYPQLASLHKHRYSVGIYQRQAELVNYLFCKI